MATSSTLDPLTHIATVSDLQIRIARIADPANDLKIKNVVAGEIREMMDTTRDTESAHVLPYLIPTLLDLLRTGDSTFRRDTLEFQFRKVLLEILSRLPVSDPVRTQLTAIYETLLHLLRVDNEDNVVSCCKIIVDVTRTYRSLSDDHLSKFTSILQETLQSVPTYVRETLSDDSPVVDPNVAVPGMKSFKALAEMGLVMAMFSQAASPRSEIIGPAIKTTIGPAFEALETEAPVQKRTREDYEAMGDFWAGMAPSMKNVGVYSDFINAQVKTLSYLAFVMRHNATRQDGQSMDTYGERLILNALRILQDCPTNAIALRKELMVVFRHLMGTPYRRALLPQINKLFDERVLLGTGIASKEMLRAPVYSAVADLFHHLKAEFSLEQLTQIVHIYSRLIHNPALGNNLHTLFAKMMIGMADAILTKDKSPAAAKLLSLMFETCLNRLDALAAIHEQVLVAMERNGDGTDTNEPVIDATLIEKARPVGGAVYALEKPEEIMMESRMVFRTLLHGFRVCLGGLKRCESPVTDGKLIFRMFEGCIRCMSYFEPESRVNETDAIDWFAPVLLEVDPHVFQEVWTHKIDFFFECAQKRIILLNICQFLFNKEPSSPPLLAIVLQFLVGKLPLLGDYDDLRAAATIRLFKMAFTSVGLFPTLNEPILAQHLAKLLMDCFPLAAKASKPTHYFHLLRALFRAIGGGGGRFELLYKEVLPLLPEMLECLNRQLLTSDGTTRDMIVELCLTVPLRLTHLLPHLAYLMQPLAIALRGNPELVSQGLRTLELCIDNLTPDFLDPTLGIVLRDLMDALHSHLKPLPANHHLSHTTIRILGKLGGRNRRLLSKEPALGWRHHSETPKLTFSFSGVTQKMEIQPVAKLASRMLNKGTYSNLMTAYEYLEACLSLIVHEGVQGRNSEDLFINALEGVFDAIHQADVQEKAEQFVRKLSQFVFESELRKGLIREQSFRPSPLLSSFLDSIPHALAREQPTEAKKAQALVASMVQDLVSYAKQNNIPLGDIYLILYHLSNRFLTLCLDDPWVRKSAGCSGIKIMTTTPDVGVKWTCDREIELVRTLLHILKDLPADLPRDIDEIVNVLKDVLKIGSSNVDFRSDDTQAQTKLINLVGIFSPELQSAVPVVRQAAQTCIELLVTLSGRSAVELLLPHRDRMLVGIYNKPLRALPFPIQIGMIEAVRYCVTLQPPLLEPNEELLRLLHETLALADAEDTALLNRSHLRQSHIEMTKLRVACIKLLTAAMPLTDFFSKQTQTRQRVTGVYFKSLYSTSSEVKDVAHEGLRMVLTHQSRLPKELLQTGLRPILMNLADPKRLSVPGLEGLARLLELLTNYFKVEIGHKLLDHFRVVADPQMLQASAKSPLGENENITKLVRLANIFHLLPSAANIFLDNLVNAIVQTEFSMHFTGQSPFSEPLAKYLDRYPIEGVEFFLKHLSFPAHLRTFQSILQAKLAPNLQRILVSRTPALLHNLQNDTTQVVPVLSLFNDMARLVPYWIHDHEYVIDELLSIWYSGDPDADLTQRHVLILSIFRCALELSPRVDLIFDIVAIFTRDLEIDVVQTTQFLYRHVALSDNVVFRRNVLMRFPTWFDRSSASWPHKTAFMRYILTPTLLAHGAAAGSNQCLVDSAFIDRIHALFWSRITDANSIFAETDDMFKIELLHLTTVMVQYYPQLVGRVQKDILKGAWHYIGASDDPVVKQTAYLLNARFFAAFPTPSKFILRTWQGLLKAPGSEGRATLRQEALAALAPTLSTVEMTDNGYPQWAITARRLVAEEGMTQLLTIYNLMVKQPALFYPVRRLFITYMVNSLNKMGLTSSSTHESRLLSIDLLQVILNWERQAAQSNTESKEDTWLTPLGYRENMVSYLVRLATMVTDGTARVAIIPRALSLLQQMVGPNGWTDIDFGLRYFVRTLEQSDLTNESVIPHAIASAKVLQVIAAEQSDAWYTSNAQMLQKLVRKGLLTDDQTLHDALHPIFDRLVKLFPLPKEEDESQGELADFHTFIHSTIGDGLRNTSTLRGVLLMLQSVVQVVPERIEHFGSHLIKLLGKILKEHVSSTGQPPSALDSSVRLLINILDICQISMAFLGEQRKWLLSNLVIMIEKSKNFHLSRYILDMVKSWTLVKRESYPTMKEKASLLLKMTAYETKGDSLFHAFLELVYDIYTEPSLRRSDLTAKLEPLFFIGCRAKDSVLRERFIDLLDVSVPRSLFSRLVYVFGVQNWEPLADHYWMHIALHLVLGATDVDAHTSHERRVGPSPLVRPKTQTIVRPMQRLFFFDPETVHETWVSIFPAAWASLSRREQTELSIHIITLLSKDYHIKQAESHPNIIQTLLTGLHACSPALNLPPHLIRYLAKTFGAWHISLEILGATLDNLKDDEITIRDFVFDSLADLYSELAEDDMFYGLCRRRSLHQETNIAIAFEQNGMWDQALTAYETAQTRSRQGLLPFIESEYCLWEDHWILASEKLQQWDHLYELGKSEGNNDLILESAWRIKDWTENLSSMEEHISQLPEVPTPRRRVFEAFIALLKMPGALDKNTEFTAILEDAMQLSLRKWISLPPHLSTAHVPLLQHFQQFVELQEAVQIFGSLSQTNAQNLEKKSNELKMVLQAWRERLPNIQDDISIWSDLVAWRQNVFNSINKAYLPLIPNQSGTPNTATAGYRGYHETAWIINRFAHVARKHDLLDVCFTSLAKIYTLPNIEISEAFLKLREQAKCYYQKPTELQAGLEVINNTNLVYFSTPQKAEFYTLKGMFHARFGRHDEANTAFGQAVQMDMGQAKSWAEWGRWNDRMFKEHPTDLSHAASAVSCYLQAAGLYKNGKSRPLLTRVLWLLSVDDNTLTVSRAFDTYKGDAAFWYWITLIPQLCTSIAQREVKQARYVLLSLARQYPQALFFQLRTTREELVGSKRAAAAAAAARAASNPSQPAAQPDGSDGTSSNSQTGDASAGDSQRPAANPALDHLGVPRPTWECVEEIVQILKTAFPLLILSLETLVEQIISRFKAVYDEELYRHICMLLQDALQNYVVRMNQPEDDGQLASHTIVHLQRLHQSMPTSLAKADFEQDFLSVNKISHYEYIQRLQRWRDKYERILDSRPRVQPLDQLSHYLVEFQYSKVDEIEVPGQYTEEKDTNQNFVRIQKLVPRYEHVRMNGYSWKRITIHGSDNSKISFTVQLPYNRSLRREERVAQLFRTFNGVLARKKESRKRNLCFHLPVAVSCAPNARLYQSDSSYIPLSDVYDMYCESTGISREDPILFSGEKVKKVITRQVNKNDYIALKKSINDEISLKKIPDDILTRYMIRTMDGPSALWRIRKQFALQVASTSFMTYVAFLGSRHPSRFQFSKTTGMISMSDLFPSIAAQHPLFAVSDAVPFRFTPAMQHFLGSTAIEGILTSGIMAIGRSLTEPEYPLDQQLCLFVRDEVANWLITRNRSPTVDLNFRQHVTINIDSIVKRAETMACKIEREQALQGSTPTMPVVMTVINLISTATNPIQLAKMGEIYYPWF
ncbi:hypothetical protein K435DRAFT_832965 [Dendrothele bispora CBS 962.96]|uniref:Atypical/PIKK/TRRAP protein kinase n=1 Tax=Dendrothele bispora (strain CBS 962.96) TaxID=1314807 RepID=A0A4S8MYI5_DENBC|nr:hypothetical protein K435DRAFT_832965 [Dendrothele bispora CBS 962.96]